MAPNKSTTVALIKPDCATGYRSTINGDTSKSGLIVDEILKRIKDEGFTILQRRTLLLIKAEVRQLNRHQWDDANFSDQLDFMVSGPSIALLLEGEDAIERWKAVMGPSDPTLAKATAAPKPHLRGLYGTTLVRNALYGSDNETCALRDKKILFPNGASMMERALAIVKPNALNYLDALSVLFEREGFFIMEKTQLRIETDDELQLLTESTDLAYTDELKTIMLSGESVVFLLEGICLTTQLELLLGPTDPAEAKVHFPSSIRAEMGVSLANNCVHALYSSPDAMSLMRKWFPSFFAREPEVTLAIIKPTTASKHGDIIQSIIEAHGFRIERRFRRRLRKDEANEFYAEHKGKPFYDALVDYMTSDDAVVLLLSRVHAIYVWRKCMGPTNSNTARELYPNSIRGRFGIDGTKNAVHGSDSPQSARREISLMFGSPVTPLGTIPTRELASKATKFTSETLHSTLAKGITELCRLDPRPDALGACEWLGQFLVHAASPDGPIEKGVQANHKKSTAQRVGRTIDLNASSFGPLHIVGFFGPSASRTFLAKQIANDFNYHYVDLYAALEKTEHEQDPMVTIVKMFKRCVWKRIILDNFPPDLPFYLSFQKHVAEFAWITVVGSNDNHAHHQDPSHYTLELPFPVHLNDERDFYQFFHRFGYLNYIAPKHDIPSTSIEHKALKEIRRPFSPRILVVNDKACVISDSQWMGLSHTYRWTVLNFKVLAELEVKKEAKTGMNGSGSVTSYTRTGENIPMDLIIRLIAQEIGRTVEHLRFIVTNVPGYALSESFMALLDTTTRAAPPSQILRIGTDPFHRAHDITLLERRWYAFGQLIYLWVDGPTSHDHLDLLFRPVLAPTNALFIDEGNNITMDRVAAQARGYTLLSVKDALRAEILRGSPDGLRINELVQANEAIPDEVVVHVLAQHLFHKFNHRLILTDGFPRTQQQVAALAKEACPSAFVIRSLELATRFEVEALSPLAHTSAIVSAGNLSCLKKQLCQVTVASVLADFDIGEVDHVRLQNHFGQDGAVVLPLAHVEATINAKQPVDEPVDAIMFVRLVCQLLMERSIRKVVFLGFPRTLDEAKAFQRIGVDCDKIVVLNKKIIPVPHEPTDEDYYSSDEEEKARKKNAPEPQISQLTRFYSETYPNAFHSFTFVEFDRMYPKVESLLFRPRITLAVGNKSSGFHAALRAATNFSDCAYIHVPELLMQHVKRYPSSHRTGRIQSAWKCGRLVDLDISMELIKSALLHSLTTHVIITGFPRVIGDSMPYIHDQMDMLEREVGTVHQLLHFTSSPAVLLSRASKIHEVHAHTDTFHEESEPLIDYCHKVKKTITVVNADVPPDTLVQDLQTLLLT
ncbi:hypothetical protein AeNC1_007340 [Aphanomyces euteiches]|nr:hypothetical protein AeNC1_007340 [Aphanomyces euteiches]